MKSKPVMVLLLATSLAAAACGADDTPFTAAAGGGSTSAGGNGPQGSGGNGGMPSGPSSSSTAGGGAPACADLGDACTVCEAAECPDRYCACYNNPSCVKIAQCDEVCPAGDLDCYQDCASANEAGISDASLLVHCAATLCKEGCPGYTPLTPCQECLYDLCPDAMNVCIANADCTALLYCLDACTDADPGCPNGCYTSHPDGFADSGPVGRCVQDQCKDACN